MKKLKNVGAPAHRCPNKGITLIALIVTIILMLILAAVTINMSINGGLFEQAGKSKFVTEVASIKEELTQKTIMAEMVDEEIEDNAIDTVLGKKTGYNDKLLVQNGELVYDKDKVTETQKTWLEEMGIQAKKPTVKDLILEGKIKVGDYVNYIPDVGTYKVADGEYGSGIDTTETGYQEFTTETGDSSLKWRILSINEETGEIELVSATAGQSLTLKGADGYNHAVDILNDLCETLYSKTAKGKKVATGRSMSVADINAKTTYSPIGETNTSTGFTYKDTKRLSEYGTDYMKYPNLYSQEIGYGTAGTFNTTGLDGETGLKNGTIDASGVTTYPAMGFTNGNTAGTDPYVTHTYYGHNGSSYTYYPEQCLDTSLGVNTAPAGLIKLSSSYWLASRCVRAYSFGANFYVRCMNSSGYVYYGYLFGSDGNSSHLSYAVRPVVSLSVDLFNFSVGDGSPENPWGMK
ncbi:MAG: hypothetical protein ACI4U9_05840 [Clostridia bacterium]